MRKFAFTLAEVLITLTIIGVIAAITIPNLLQKYQNYQLATKFQKAYAVLSEAVRITTYDEFDLGRLGSTSANNDFVTVLREHLKVHKYCGYITPATWTSPCYPSQKAIKKLNGEALAVGSSLLPYGIHGYNLILEDGTFIALDMSHTSSNTNWAIANIGARIAFTVDVNGLDQGPNKIGRDIFYIKMDESGKLSPYGVGVADDCINGGTGNTCAKKIIVDKILDY